MATILLSGFQARALIAGRTAGQVEIMSSIDLGLSRLKASLSEAGAGFPEQTISWEILKKIAGEERKVFRVIDGCLEPVQVFSETTGWMRTLCATQGAPTVLVSGIPMHRIKDTDPMADTLTKIKALGNVRGKVLDTATGLGYTAIEAAKTASEVVTLELDPAALTIAAMNPWSRGLFERPNITRILGDAYEEVESLPAMSFGGILHDPPTMALGGDLYSEKFYRSLHRLLSRKGRLFHYIGDPNSALGKRTWPGVMKRLGAAGFTQVTRHPEAFGVTAVA